ncbi:CBS domain-containing protein [Benzoatithermus flavus]|uniref:CBS domain-containing protein n=1 Tax=Benzoatithermus flavus TaxID=3108223 RepID=A0ABU8XRK1_9PROT
MHIQTILARKGNEVRTIGPETTVGEAVRRMREERVGCLVVSSDGAKIQGIISERGIMHAIADRGVGVLNEPVRSIMTERVFTCTPEDRIGTLMAMMTERRIRHIPVVDGDGRLCGLVSIGDVVKHRLDEIQSEAEAMREYIAGMH